MTIVNLNDNVANERRQRRSSTRLLTDELALKIPPPRTGRKEIWHEKAQGLVLRITSNNARSWAVTFKVRDPARSGQRGDARMGVKGKAQKITLGPVEKITLKEAVARAGEIFEQANRGIDPRAKLDAARETRRVNTVRAVGEKMTAAAKKTNRAWQTQESYLRNHVYPRIGDRPVAEITRADVIDLLDALKEEKTVATAREVRKHLGRLMNWAANRTIIPVNPMWKLEDNELVYRRRKRVLTDAELRAVWIAADTLGYPYSAAVRLLMLTGQRKTEILHARWTEIDAKDRALLVPAERHKKDRDHLIPLTDAAWKIIDELPRHQGYDNLFLVSPRTRSDETLVAANMGTDVVEKLRAAALVVLQENDPEAKLEHFTIHDLRRTCETRLAALKVLQEHIDRVMGHVMQGMAATYNRYDYLTEKRAALRKYERHVLGIVK